MDPKKHFFLKNPPGFLAFETSSCILTSNRSFWPAPIYRDINFVLKCLPERCAPNPAHGIIYHRFFKLQFYKHTVLFWNICRVAKTRGNRLFSYKINREFVSLVKWIMWVTICSSVTRTFECASKSVGERKVLSKKYWGVYIFYNSSKNLFLNKVIKTIFEERFSQ